LRFNQLDERLESFEGEFASHLPDDPAPFLRRILREASTRDRASGL
jgi:hypothetical protein